MTTKFEAFKCSALAVMGSLAMVAEVAVAADAIDGVAVRADSLNAAGATPTTVGNGTAVDINGTLTVDNTSVGGSLDVTGATMLGAATQINNILDVTGHTSLSTLSTLSTSGHATLDSASVTHNLDVGGNASIDGNLRVNGHTRLGRLTVSGGNSELSVANGQSHLRTGGGQLLISSTRAPVKLSGVADGSATYDAINVRQLAGSVSAVAAVASIPAPMAGQDRTVGVGLGRHMGQAALAPGANYRMTESSVIKASLASSLSGKAKPVFGIGAGFAW